jgi:FkbH-like protein
MSVSRPATLVVSTFNVTGFCALGRNDDAPPGLEFESAPLARLYTPATGSQADYALVWTQPETALPAFHRFLETRRADPEALRLEVDAFADALVRFAEPFKLVFVPVWVAPPWLRDPRLLEMNPTAGLGYWLARLNLQLADRLAGQPRLLCLNTANWMEAAGKHAFSAKLWHLAKIPFGNEVFKSALHEVKSAVGALQGRMRKLIVLDLDETLWGGILGEVGYRNLNLGGHDAKGEALVEFQRQLKRLAGRGILLAIASKNDDALALEAMTQHPEMVLRPGDFAARRINWDDKAANIAAMLQELNLPASAAVFIDDHPAERDRVRAALPDVLTPDWPVDPLLYAEALAGLGCFETLGVTADDQRRTELYQQAREAGETRAAFGSLDDWIASLQQKVTVESASGANQPRALQLLNKTNQMNLATRRLSEAEFSQWLADKDHTVWTFRVADKFGDAGLTGLVGVAWQGTTAEITDFLLSCRVMGRKVEEAMLAVVAQAALARGAHQLRARLNDTGRNAPCRQFWESRPETTRDETGVYLTPAGAVAAPVRGIEVFITPA